MLWLERDDRLVTDKVRYVKLTLSPKQQLIESSFVFPVADLGGPSPPPGPVKTSQKKMAAMRGHKFRKSCAPTPLKNF